MNTKIIGVQIALLIFLCIVITSVHSLDADESLIGEWHGTYQGHDIRFNLREDLTCELCYVDVESQKEQTIQGACQVDFSKKPIPLSISNIPTLSHSLHTIIQFVGEDEMHMMGFASRWKLRPISFQADRMIVLKKVAAGQTATGVRE